MKHGIALAVGLVGTMALTATAAPPSDGTTQTDQQPVVRERDRLLAEATARAERLQVADSSNPFRTWQVLGGRPGLSDAKLIEYEGGRVMLLKQDGTTRTFPEVRLGKIDRKFFDEWKKMTAPLNTAPGSRRPVRQPTKPAKPKVPAS